MGSFASAPRRRLVLKLADAYLHIFRKKESREGISYDIFRPYKI